MHCLRSPVNTDLSVGAKFTNASDRYIAKAINMDAKFIQVFTDGSFSSSHPDVCGIGVHFPNGDFKDLSEPFKIQPTNQRAELMAIFRAIQTVREKDPDSRIEIHTDSKYAIGACTHWLANWKRHGWKRQIKRPNGTYEWKNVMNQDILRPLSSVLKNVVFHHVRAHTKLQDHMSLCNAKADALAKMGCTKSIETLKNESAGTNLCTTDS